MKSTIHHPVLGTLEVSWDYTPAESGDLECPPSEEEYEIYEINGKEPDEYFTEKALREIEEMIKDGRTEMIGEHEIAREESRRESLKDY